MESREDKFMQEMFFKEHAYVFSFISLLVNWHISLICLERMVSMIVKCGGWREEMIWGQDWLGDSKIR